MTDIDTANTRLDARQRRHDRLSARLASLGDDELTTLLAGAPAWRNHIHGNQSGVIQSEGRSSSRRSP
ncbi:MULTISPECIES: hypothetical protein [Phenylobacterium]|uniref:Uncharacterized protein n=1 Tax=Phenylobacterium koreense TaxID=266125 RepID=A0ABV2EH76_9CAUL